MSANSASQSSHAPPTPLKIVLAIAIFFPYGFYLLWKHPTLGKKPGWWIGGIAYVAFAMVVAGMSEPTPAQLIPKAEYLEKRQVSQDTRNPGGKLAALKVVASHLKDYPDRFAPDSEKTAFNDELQTLIDRFTGIAFDARQNPSVAKSIVQLFENKIEGKFSGHPYNILMEHVQGIYSESLDR